MITKLTKPVAYANWNRRFLHMSSYWLCTDKTVIIKNQDIDIVLSELIEMVRTHEKIHLNHAPHSNLPG